MLQRQRNDFTSNGHLTTSRAISFSYISSLLIILGISLPFTTDSELLLGAIYGSLANNSRQIESIVSYIFAPNVTIKKLFRKATKTPT